MKRRKFITTAITTAVCTGITSFAVYKYLNHSNSSLSAENIGTISSKYPNIDKLLKRNKNISLKESARLAKKFYGTAISETALEKDKAYRDRKFTVSTFRVSIFFPGDVYLSCFDT